MAIANANSIVVGMSPVNDGLGTIGAASEFAVVNGSFSLDTSSRAALIQLVFNYNVNASSTLGQWTTDGLKLNVGDLLLQVGTDEYGIALKSHTGAPNGVPAGLTSSSFASVTQGEVYQESGNSVYLTTTQVLNNPGGVQYRNNTAVWLGGTLTDLGSLTETITHVGSVYTVNLSGNLNSTLVQDIANHQSLKLDFGSATCANGYLVGNYDGKVPEPMTLGLMGSGLILFGVLRFERKKKQ